MDALNLKADLSEELAIVRALIAENGQPRLTREVIEEAAKSGPSRLVSIPTFRAADGTFVQFFPVDDRILRQTSTHRVVINGKAAGWLSSAYKPNAKAARFFLSTRAAR